MKFENRSFTIPVPKVNFEWKSWLPSRGNVIFTTLMILLLVWAQTVGAFPALNSTSNSTGTIAYQGRLADSSGNPLTNTLNMSFRLYGATTGGSPLWTEEWTGSNGVQVSDGLFNVMLGSLTPIPQSVIAGNSNLFLGITVGTDDEMAPRVQLGSVPFAVQALTVPDGSITKAKLAPDVSLVPPDGSVTTAKIADGAVTSQKLAVNMPALLGHKTCNACGNVTESNLTSWNPIKGTDSQDVIEVTVTTHGRPIAVTMTARYQRTPASTPWCGISVMSQGSEVRFTHLDGIGTGSTADFGCSGEYLFTDLPAGTYTFRAMGWLHPTATVTWSYSRQIAVYEY
ncbi:MAG: hypothetical protein WAU10_09835 [Caldilineaceae bacterium]